jgi:enoyl-CoA hydratase/3-hydroxyacyl-CoA dehydrogenase
MFRPGDVVTVLGAGNMGSGIAQILAAAGYHVKVRDLTDKDIERGRNIIQENLQRSVNKGKMTLEKMSKQLALIEFTTKLDDAVKDARLIIEAVFEDEKVKRALFEEVAKLASNDAIVVTNTSSLLVKRLFEGFPYPERTAGLHFFYPASINRLIEIIPSPQTSKETLAGLKDLSFSMKKIPIRTADSSGFCVNRFFVPFLNEATRIVEEGAANIATVDEAANECLGTHMGPFALMNVIGIPIAYHAVSSLGQSFGPFYAPSALLKGQFDKGEKWPTEGDVDSGKKDGVRARLLGVILGISTHLVEEGVTTAEETDRAAQVGLQWDAGPFSMINTMGAFAALDLVQKIHGRWGNDFPMTERLSEIGISGEEWPISTVQVERDGPLAWILIDRPEAMNALNLKVLKDVQKAVQQCSSDPDVKALLLGSTSDVFAAGADISAMVGMTAAQAQEFLGYGQKVLRSIETTEKPVIAVVDGYALGGGLELALSADFILASERATLGLPEVSLGIMPGFGGTQRLPRLVGKAKAKMMVMGALQIKAKEAYEMGLVARIYPPEKLKDEARAMALTIVSRAPVAVRLAKESIERGLDGTLDAGQALERELATYTFTTEDLREGMKAFIERRPPAYKGK